MSDDTDPPREEGGKGRSREQFRVPGDELVAKLKELIREGNVRHIVIKNDEGRTLIEVPLSLGVVGAVLLPVWAAIGAIAAVVTKCSVEIEREAEDDATEDDDDEA
jgi:hypothetical protein